MLFSSWVKIKCSNNEWINDGTIWGVKLSYTLWGLWKAQNIRVFNGTVKKAKEVIDKAVVLAKEAMRLPAKRNTRHGSRAMWIVDSLPQMKGG
nr:unnamed protein product [Ipomoea batatas]GME06739.1 unnamed protein product [Ipomoea batatas]